MLTMKRGETLREYKRGSFTVRLYTEPDDNPDLSFLGEFSNKPEKVHIDHHERQTRKYGAPERHSYRYFNAGCGDPDYIEEDYKRMCAYNDQQWCMLIIGAEVFWRDKRIAWDTLSGVESDAGDYILTSAREVAREAIASAREEMKAMRRELCGKEAR